MISIGYKTIQFEKFPNGETRIVQESLPERNEMIRRLSFKYEEDGDLIKLMMVKNYLDTMNVKCNGLLIYYMPYSRMDRSENDSPFTLKYVANFINSLGFERVEIIEPHSDVTNALIDNAVPNYINTILAPKVANEIGFGEGENGEGDRIFFPDAGAQKRYIGKIQAPYLVGNKNRDFKTGDIKSLEIMGGKVENPNKILIIDDLSSYGGTFVHSAKALRDLGFKEIYLLVGHAENSIFKGKLFENIDKVFTTDTILSDDIGIYEHESKNKLKVYDIEGVL